jgi:methylenetetrahydrofolate reductase (NADPH)
VREIWPRAAAAAPHFSCIGATKDSVRAQLACGLKAMGVKRIVALRGDLPSGYGAGRRVPLRQRPGGLHPRRDRRPLSTLKWPPTPRCTPRPQPEADLQAFATKVKAGANSAITQYFFNSDAYFRFVDDCEALGVEVPVVPGIMPITKLAPS